jgi:natural product biosynthesis luciferase-like monooxygenase protein
MQLSGLSAAFIGEESLLVQCAQAWLDRGHRITAVVTRNAASRQWLARHRLPCLSDPGELLAAEGGACDLLLSITNLRVLPEALIRLPRLAAVNFHDGPLPQYAGLNTPVWALLAGEPEHGITWHRMIKGVDQGAVLVQRRFPIDPNETALSLNTKCFAAAIESFDELMGQAEAGRLSGTPQPGPIERYCARKDRPQASATIDFDQPAEQVARLVRALDFGAYANPVTASKLWLGGPHLWVVGAADLRPDVNGEPGTVVASCDRTITVAASRGGVVLSRLSDLAGRPVVPSEALRLLGLLPPARLPHLDEAARIRLTQVCERAAVAEGASIARLRMADPLDLPLVDRSRPAGPPDFRCVDAACLEAGGDAVATAATWLAALGRLADKGRFDVGLDTAAWQLTRAGLEPWFAAFAPLPVDIDFSRPIRALEDRLRQEADRLASAAGVTSDLGLRLPDLRATVAASGWPVAIMVGGEVVQPPGGCELLVHVSADGQRCRLWHDTTRLSAADVDRLVAAWAALASGAASSPEVPVGQLPLMRPSLRAQVVHGWNASAGDVVADRCMHDLFDEQAARTPDREALRCADRVLSYAQVQRRANQLANRLIQAGVGPDMLVGLFMSRSVDLVVAAIAVHKAGGAYVPLDPAYPRDRIAYMVEDARMPVLLTEQALLDELPDHRAEVICVDADWPTIAALSTLAPAARARAADLAYVIYTSGSTGRPKGVMIEHRNAVNFFGGMDDRLGAAEPGTWLAVTSLSFDISVLELFWTLTRGFTVIISSEDARVATGPARGAAASRPLDFSLFYFSSDESERGSDKYRLLMEGARYADRHGFSAVWTPERHFHAFGGLYPNPAVTSAAVAAVTQRVKIRSGSVVLPLHHPARIAEEWAVVDNLSNGRVGVSFASGWQPNDFVLKPENFKNNKQVLVDGIDTVRRLWKGESVSFPGPLGEPVAIRTLPRPVQAELPVWVTSAGNPETFVVAGRLGANVLTHLLGQTVEELEGKLAAYRQAWKQAGHSGEGHVTLMLHTFVGPDEARVRETVRRPLIEYLRSSVSLVKQYAWSFPAFKRREGMDTAPDSVDLQSLAPDEMDALLEHSFERYYATSGLFGTPETCLEMVDRIKGVGVDEVACLIDFGVASDAVLEHLPFLNRLRKLSMPPPAAGADHSVPALLARHAVTHLQCTPSLARLLTAHEAAAERLAGLRCMMVGGEAFPLPLAAELKRLIPAGRVLNMYGPTETTIWSAVHEVGPIDGGVPLGLPLRNQTLHVVDARRQVLPPGFPGELVIGGLGVVRGYLNRPDLTSERFVPDPFAPGARMYRTGDLVRRRDDGLIDFLGRLDHQVKVRGFRIELGEIEVAMLACPGVAESVVVAREDSPGDVRLVGYLVASAVEPSVDLNLLKATLKDRLPDYMVPAHLVVLGAMPQTPNGKIDRKALPAPQADAAPTASADFVAPSGETAELIAQVWRDVLKLPQVGARDNFFDLGGHSLLAVQAHRRLREALQVDLAITDIFRFPTIDSLSRFLAEGPRTAAAAAGQDRAAGRRAALQRRQATRSGVPQP